MGKRTQPYRYGVPAKYLEGLSDAEAKKRALEILATAVALTPVESEILIIGGVL